MKLDRALRFTSKDWDKIGQFIRGAIKKDALNGIMQDDKKPKLRSSTYKKYKKNDMRKFGRGDDKIGKGNRLKQFIGRSLNNDTSKVNLHLTGDMMKKIQIKSTSDKTTIIFLEGEKVLGNKKNGYNVHNVRNENRKKALNFLANTIQKNLDKETSKPINLKLGKR